MLAIIAAPWLMPLFAPGLDPALVDQTVTMARIMFPIVVLLGLTGLVAAILQAGGRFGPTAFAPVLWNMVIIGGLVAVTPFVPDDDKVIVYAVAVVVGTLAQLLYLLPSLRGLGPFPLSFGFRNPMVRRVLILMLPVTLGLGLININLTVDTVFATLVSDQAPRAIDAAFRLYLLPQGVFSVAISTVLFPTISRLAARDDVLGLRQTIASGMRQIFFMLLPASAFLLVLAEPVVKLVFQRGEFGPASTALTSGALFFFAIGLAFNGASLLVIRAFFSMQIPWIADQGGGPRGGAEPGRSTPRCTSRWAPTASRWPPRSPASSPSACWCGCWTASWAGCTAPGSWTGWRAAWWPAACRCCWPGRRGRC